MPQDMLAVPFRDKQRFAVVGSPTCFAQHKPPTISSDLNAHRCVRTRMSSGAIYQWEFERHGEAARVDGKGWLVLDEPSLMLEGKCFYCCFGFRNGCVHGVSPVSNALQMQVLDIGQSDER